MITQEIKLYEEPLPVKPQHTTQVNTDNKYGFYRQYSFLEVVSEVQRAKMNRIEIGSIFRNKHTGSLIRVESFVKTPDELDETHNTYNGKPMVIQASHSTVKYELYYGVDELLNLNYERVL